MKECFRVKNVMIKDSHLGCSGPRFRVRVNFCIVDEHGFESATNQEEKLCRTWTEAENFISRYCDKEEAKHIVDLYVRYFQIRFKKLHS